MLIASFVNHWKQNFLVSVISLLIMLILYTVLNSFLEKRMVTKEVKGSNDSEKTVKEKAPMLPLMFSSGLIAFLIVSLLRVAIDNGIKMMTPVMLMESYDSLPAAIATRISSVLIIFSALGTLVAGFMKSNITKSEPKAQIIFYGASILPLLAVCFVGEISCIWILAALCVAVMLVHGAGPFSQSFVALRFEKYGRIGTVSGILNATASVGNILASYIFAKMAELMPWKAVGASWLMVIVLCGFLCVAILPRWTRFIKR